MQIVIVNGRPGVFTWTGGFKTRREDSLHTQARKSDDHLLQVCLWLENHGQKEEALVLMEQVLN